MNSKYRYLFTLYFFLYSLISGSRLKNQDIESREIHALLISVLTTSPLMWAYALMANYTIANPIPGIIGMIFSIIHILSPLLFRYTNNSYFITNVVLSAGIIHMGTFAYFTGGFQSPSFIWCALIPILGGINCGLKATVTWGVFILFLATTFFIFDSSGFQFPNETTETGKNLSQVLLIFGWIFASSVMVVVLSEMRRHTENLLHQQNVKIDDLFRVLFHDLANPLGRVSIGLTIAKKSVADANNRGLLIAAQASDSMIEITQNIRKMYAVSRGKANMDLLLTSLNSAIEYTNEVCASEFERKKIKLEYDFKENERIHILVEPISFNNQVLGNIISNAIKFSSDESTIHVKAYAQSPGRITVEIRDHGIGIPKDILPNLFDINKKTSRPGTHGEIGTGFGLHIMKSFVEVYGGELEVESRDSLSEFPSGTTIKLTLNGQIS